MQQNVNLITRRFFFQVTIVPRMGEEKGAVRFRSDHTKFELQSVRYAPS